MAGEPAELDLTNLSDKDFVDRFVEVSMLSGRMETTAGLVGHALVAANLFKCKNELLRRLTDRSAEIARLQQSALAR